MSLQILDKDGGHDCCAGLAGRPLLGTYRMLSHEWSRIRQGIVSTVVLRYGT